MDQQKKKFNLPNFSTKSVADFFQSAGKLFSKFFGNLACLAKRLFKGNRLPATLGMVVGILAVVLSVVLFVSALTPRTIGYPDTGTRTSYSYYGGDAYSGIQQAGADTARNVKLQSEIIASSSRIMLSELSSVKLGPAMILFCLGLGMICYFAHKLMELDARTAFETQLLNAIRGQEDPVITEEPEIAEAPAAEEAPVSVEEPEAVETPVVVEAPAAEKKPAFNFSMFFRKKSPAKEDAPIEEEAPAAEEAPAVEPVVVEEPVAADEPVFNFTTIVRKKAPAAEAAPIEEETPATEPVVVEEPVAADEPAASEDETEAPIL